MAKIRVSFVTQDLVAGALLFGNQRFAKRLIELGHEAEFVAIDTSETSATESLPPGVTWAALGADRVRKAPWRLARHFRRSRPEVVFVSGFIQGLTCLLAARMMRRPPRIVIRAHVVSSTYLASQTSAIDRTMLVPLLRRSRSHRVGFAAVSNAGARDLENVLGFPMGSVATLYDPVLPVEARRLQSFEHPWLDDASTPILLAVGRLVPAKDFATLVRAFKIVLQEQPTWRLVILGDGHERARLEKLISELDIARSVLLPGFVNPANGYQRADLFVCSSVTEGLCNVIIEALAEGCSVVSTDCPVGPSEILLGGALGKLVPVGDPEALAAAMLGATSQACDRNAAIRRAADFHIDRVWPQFAQLAGIT